MNFYKISSALTFDCERILIKRFLSLLSTKFLVNTGLFSESWDREASRDRAASALKTCKLAIRGKPQKCPE
jgi:hypothetical protein